MQLKFDRIMSLLNKAIKWEVLDVLIYLAGHEEKGERKKAVSSLPVVSRPLSSVSLNCELPMNYHCIEYND